MIDTIVSKNGSESGVTLFKADGVLQSVHPASHAYGMTYHFGMVPYCKPQNVLMLGYGLGTVAELTRTVWGADIKVTAVDVLPNPEKYFEFKYIQGDAEKVVTEFNRGLIKTRFDFVLIDLFQGSHSADFIFTSHFAKQIYSITRKAVYINTTREESNGLRPYEDAGFNCEKDRIVIVGGNVVSLWTK